VQGKNAEENTNGRSRKDVAGTVKKKLCRGKWVGVRNEWRCHGGLW